MRTDTLNHLMNSLRVSKDAVVRHCIRLTMLKDKADYHPNEVKLLQDFIKDRVNDIIDQQETIRLYIGDEDYNDIPEVIQAKLELDRIELPTWVKKFK